MDMRGRATIIAGMDFVASWLRQLLKAGTAAALVPAAMVVALAVVAAGSGGLGGLGSLAQLVTGPQISTAERAGASSAGESDVAIVAPPTIAAAPAASPPGAVPRARPAPAPRRQSPQPAPNPQPQSPPAVRPPSPVVAPPVAATPVDRPEPQGPPAPPTVRERTGALVAELGDVVDEVVVVLEKVIESLGQSVDRILNGPPLGRP